MAVGGYNSKGDAIPVSIYGGGNAEDGKFLPYSNTYSLVYKYHYRFYYQYSLKFFN